MQQKILNYTPKDVALYISTGLIGAFAKGKAEVGPRALGNRSIIADARDIKSKERINGLIKQRSAFQPVAPLCIEDDFDFFFEKINCEISLDYMLYAVKCKPNTKNVLPAIVHVDNTSRVQLITSKNYPFLFDLLTEYKKITGLGVLINTSFNGKGEPIVNTAQEAYTNYKKLDLDFLVLDNFLITNKI